jgi:23S rRNA pseudouridine1911/1915/1917 synthase
VIAEENKDQEEEELFEHYSITVDEGQAPLRIDKFLIDRVPVSRTRIQMAAKFGLIKVDEQSVKSNYKVKSGENISFLLPHPKKEFELKPEKIALDIVFEDEDVILLNKPAGLVVHPGHGNYSGTLINGLIYYCKSLVANFEGQDRPGLVHRLDKDTTGIMVIAKNENALAHLAKQFFNRTTERKYVALVWGDLEEEEGTIEGHIGRSLKNRKVMDVFPDGEYGKHAVTHYKVIQRFNYVTLVECRLETGRTHQIRAHFQHIGHPLFNDATYGGDKILKGTTFTKYKQFIHNCFKTLPRQALHAQTLGFEHPTKLERVHFTSELPNDLSSLLEKWEGYIENRKI